MSLASDRRGSFIKPLQAEVVQRAIPYPLVIVFEYEQSLDISLADKRINRADSSKLTVAHFYESGWLSTDTNNWRATTDKFQRRCSGLQALLPSTYVGFVISNEKYRFITN